MKRIYMRELVVLIFTFPECQDPGLLLNRLQTKESFIFSLIGDRVGP